MKVDGFKKFIFSGAIILLLAPLFVFGQESQAMLKEKQALDILSIIGKDPLSRAQFETINDALYWPEKDYARHSGAIVLTKQTILKSNLDYWLVKMPVEFSKRFIKAVYKLLPLVAYGDFSGAVDLIEKYTVEQANNYINNWLQENQTLIGSGIGQYDFVSFKGNYQVINIPYIIVYSPIDANKAKIVVEFYSQKAIEPPVGTSPSGLAGALQNPQSNCWLWDSWLIKERQGNNDGKIEPFIVRVKGQIIKDKYGNFTWDKTAGQATVEVEFGKPVPEIDQSDVILKTLEANKSQGFLKDKINEIKKKAQGIVDLVNNFFSVFNSSKPQAQISSFTGEGPLEVTGWQEGLDDIAQQGQIIAQHTEEIVTEENATSMEQMVEKMEKAVEVIIAVATTSEQNVASLASSSQASFTQPTTTLCLKATTQESAFDKVIFNEIAWMGTTKSSSDEWIELKNISVSSVDLNGWQIFNKSQNIKIIFSTSTIVKAGDLFLLERTDDNSVANIKADYIYTGALSNTDEAVYLVDANCVLQDKIKTSPYWQEGDNITKETMERNQFYGWQTSSVVGGTPKAKNSIGKTKPITSGGGSASANSQFSITNFQNATSTATTTGVATSTQQATTTLATTTQQATSTIQAPQVLIVEIQIEDGLSTQNDFIKLFNQSTSLYVDISGWQLKKRTSGTTESSIKSFSSSGEYSIQPQEYFIWMNSAYELTTTTKPNATTTQKISENNSIALLNTNDEIVDQVAWGSSTNPFVEGTAFLENPNENQNLLRKFSTSTSQYQDTNDNSQDFELASISTSSVQEQPEILLPAITNLMAVPSTVRGAVDLFWTCPTTAIAYIIKKSEQEITTTTWDLALTISQNIVPKMPGEIEFLQVDGLEVNKKTYFAIKYLGLPYGTSTISDNFSVKAWPGFGDNNDGTLTDLRTGLEWFKDASSSMNNFGASTTQDGAIEFITNQQTEWRLPNFKELASLFDYKIGGGQVEKQFENIEKQKYWSSSKRMTNHPDWGVVPQYDGWPFDFNNGKVEASSYQTGQNSAFYPFMAVKNQGIKGGLTDNDFDFIDNNDQTITDNRTGLMWLNSMLAQTINNRKTWNQAWHFANNAVLCNDGTLQGTYSVAGDCSNNGGAKYSDWRMPNIQEIIELTKLNIKDGIPVILPPLSGGVSSYWSATLFDENKAWYVNDGAYYGSVDYLSKTAEAFNIQLVRED